VARTLIAGLRTATRTGGFTVRREKVNSQPGAVFFDPEGRVGGVMVLDVADAQIQGVSSITIPTSCGTWVRWPTFAFCCASSDRASSSRAQAGLRPRRTDREVLHVDCREPGTADEGIATSPEPLNRL
jgi:hypothetical protein